MKLWTFLGILCAVILHLGVLLFGGLIFPKDEHAGGKLQTVELLSDVDAQPEKEKDKEPEKDPIAEDEKLESETEQPPDSAEIIRSLDASPTNDAPALEAVSLSAIEAALSGQSGAGGDFGDSLSFASGGRIGGTGKAGAMHETLETAFSLAEIDQDPRAISTVTPLYPAELRPKKLEGVVTLEFIVDVNGSVMRPRVATSTHPSFDKPALNAIKKWKYEPAMRAGKRVPKKLRMDFRFQPS